MQEANGILANKVRDILGIMVEINQHEEAGKHYLEIITPPYKVPISLRGVYYTRSGSTKQELKGNALIEFLLRKTGKTWDGIIRLNRGWNKLYFNGLISGSFVFWG